MLKTLKLKNNFIYLFKYNTLRNFFIGKFLSDNAKWIQITTIPWLIYKITDSPIELGIVAFLEYIPILFIPPIAGIIIKNFSRKKLIILVNYCFFILFTLLSLLFFYKLLQIWHLYIISLITGILTSFDLTIRQILISDIVVKEKIINALGFNSLLSNIARFLSPSIAGFIISCSNEGFCFIFNIILILSAIVFYYKINIININLQNNNPYNYLKEYKENLKTTFLFLKKENSIKYMLILIALIGAAMATPVVLMPIFAKNIYKLSSFGFGILLSARGLGALLATFTLISKNKSDNLNKKAFNISLYILIFIILFGLIKNTYISFILFAVLGYCMVMNTGYINSFIQISTPKEIKSVIIGFFVSCFLGFVPIGNLIAGYLSSYISVQLTCIFIGSFSILIYSILRIKSN